MKLETTLAVEMKLGIAPLDSSHREGGQVNPGLRVAGRYLYRGRAVV